MKKLSLLTTCLCLCMLPTFAQEQESTAVPEQTKTFTHEQGGLYITPKVGGSLSKFLGVDTSGMRFGLAAGLEFEGFLTDDVSLSFEAMYARQGGEKVLDGTKTKIRVDYLRLPFMANFYVLKGLAVRMGIQMGVAISNHFNQSDTNRSGNLSDIGYKAREFEMSIPVGLMYEFKNHITIDARYNISTSKFFIDGDATRFNSFTLTIGYRLKHD